MILPLVHQIFADSYLETRDHVAAYMVAYPSAKKRSAQSLASKLLKNIDVLNYIEGKLKEISDAVKGEQVQIEANKILSHLEKRAILAEISRGEAVFEDIVIIQGSPIPISRSPNLKERILAIKEDNIMSGDIAVKKTENRNVDKDGNDILPTPYILYPKTQAELEAELNAET